MPAIHNAPPMQQPPMQRNIPPMPINEPTMQNNVVPMPSNVLPTQNNVVHGQSNMVVPEQGSMLALLNSNDMPPDYNNLAPHNQHNIAQSFQNNMVATPGQNYAMPQGGMFHDNMAAHGHKNVVVADRNSLMPPPQHNTQSNVNIQGNILPHNQIPHNFNMQLQHPVQNASNVGHMNHAQNNQLKQANFNVNYQMNNTYLLQQNNQNFNQQFQGQNATHRNDKHIVQNVPEKGLFV